MAAGKWNMQKASGGVASITVADGVGATNIVLPESGTVATTSNIVGFKNYIINGGFNVWQRGVAPTITTSPTYGKADRFLCYVSDGTSVSGYIEQSLDTNFNSGYRLWLSALSYTNGVWAIQQRIESFNSKYLNSKKVTVSFRIYHDFGSTRAITVTLSKPTSLDNFGSTSIVGSVYTSQPIPTATYTNVTASFTIGSSDATNGLMLQINALSAETATSKNVLIGDIQLEEGSVTTPFEQRPVGLELSLCQRYYEVVNTSFITSYALNGNSLGGLVKFNVTKRVQPTLLPVGDAFLHTNVNVGISYQAGISLDSFVEYRTMQASAGSMQYSTRFAVDAEL